MNTLYEKTLTIQNQLAENIARARILRGLTQEDLAVQCGVTTRVIQRLEAGENIHLTTWLRVLTLLDYSNDVLFVLQETKPKTIEQMVSISDGTFEKRKRVRK